jgi:hypothetical protein
MVRAPLIDGWRLKGHSTQPVSPSPGSAATGFDLRERRNQFPRRRVHGAGRPPNFGEIFMRVLFGIILGVALTVSVAFISDTWSTGPTTNGSGSATVEHRNMVNWDVVGDNTRIARERLNAAWNRLVH